MANIVGTPGKDTLTGTNSKDTITALDDDDLIDGRGGNDWLSGDGGHDSLFGGDGKDTLSGGAGNDFLTGGAASDLLDGGVGDDRFLYSAVSDSFANKVDTIIGFESGASYLSGDKIDITALAGSGVAWNGTSAIAHGAWYQAAADGVNLMVDVTGDSAADLEVFVQGSVSLRHSDVLGVLNAGPTALNDANTGDAVIESGSSGGDPTASGNVLANDTDANGDAIVITNPGTLPGTYGSLVLAADGSWTYTLADGQPATDALAQGQSVTEDFVYSVSDGLVTSSATLTITITGTNDAAVITGDTSGVAVEELSDVSGLNPSGHLYSVDVDGTNNVFQGLPYSIQTESGLGSYYVASNGYWSYGADNENPLVQGLVDGEFLFDSFTAYAQDGTAQTIDIEIQGRNDAPQIITSYFGPALEDTPYVFGHASGNPIDIVDVDTDELIVTLTAGNELDPNAGNGIFALSGIDGLTFLDGGPVSASMTFSGTQEAINAALEGMTLTVLQPNYFGGPIPFDVHVTDGILSNEWHVDLGALPVNDAPSGVDQTISTNEGTPITLTSAAFPMTDPLDPGNWWYPQSVLAAVKISTLPTAGALTYGDVAVTEGQIISVADLDAGMLQFAPAPHAGGDAYASFTFQVQDNGGTENGGIDLDPAPNSMVINVLPVDDVLVGTGSNDILVGGPGSDTMTGAGGADTFKWAQGDQDVDVIPVDTLIDFDETLGSDALDLADLLVDENAGNLGDYLDFAFDAGNTTISVISAGSGGDVDQQILLMGVDFSGIGDESTIISNLLAASKLIVD